MVWIAPSCTHPAKLAAGRVDQCRARLWRTDACGHNGQRVETSTAGALIRQSF